MTTAYCVVLITAPPGRKAAFLADKIVSRRLAACVNIVPAVRSIYWWKGKRERAKEALLIVKTRRALVNKLIARVRKIHPYTVPEVIALPISSGNPAYLKWLAAETR